jgi:endonuclease/exonuclease/phosphatase family metal-dependent hydrolase
MQLNAWGGRMEPQIRDLLEAEKPDILCLQEIISYSADGSGLFITLEEIQEIAGLSFAAFAPVFSFGFMKGTAKFGNAILSRYPIKETRTIFTHLEHKEGFVWGEDSPNVRNFVHAAIESEVGLLHVVTHHGFWVANHKNGNTETLQQTKIIADYCSVLTGPKILTGDFNLVPESDSIKQINEVMTNLTLQHGLKTTRTPLTSKTEACDYIFISPGIATTSFAALEKQASDHQALVLEFQV